MFNKPSRIHVYDHINGGTLAQRIRDSLIFTAKQMRNEDRALNDSFYENLPDKDGDAEDEFTEKWPTGPISYTEVCTIMFKLLEVVQRMHKCNIIHRNINPHNIVFTKCNDATSLKLINFENAIYIGESDEIETHCNSMLKDLNLGQFLKMRNTLMNNIKVHENPSAAEDWQDIEGTLQYLAPERAIQQPYDTKVDIFSVGIIFYMMLGMPIFIIVLKILANCHPYEHIMGQNLKEYVKNIKFMEERLKQPNMSWNEFEGNAIKFI